MTDYQDLDPKSTFKIAEPSERGGNKFFYSPDWDSPELPKRVRYAIRCILIVTAAGLWGVLIGAMIK